MSAFGLFLEQAVFWYQCTHSVSLHHKVLKSQHTDVSGPTFKFNKKHNTNVIKVMDQIYNQNMKKIAELVNIRWIPNLEQIGIHQSYSY